MIKPKLKNKLTKFLAISLISLSLSLGGFGLALAGQQGGSGTSDVGAVGGAAPKNDSPAAAVTPPATAPSTPSPTPTPNGTTANTGDTATAGIKSTNPTESELFPSFTYVDSEGKPNAKANEGKSTKIGAVNSLSKASWQSALSSIVKMLLNIAGGLTLLTLTVGGAFMVASQGKTDLLEKGKKIVIDAVIGLIIISVSYALVIGISEFKFFS